MSAWSVYFVRTREGALYTGIATDVERRLGEHESGAGAKCLRGRGPLALVYAKEVGARGEALRIEHALKRLSKEEKESIAAEDSSAATLRALVGPDG